MESSTYQHLYTKTFCMKSMLFILIYLLSVNISSAQPPVSDSSGNLTIRGNSYYCIDGIKVRSHAILTKTSLEEVTVITGGIPGTYGDLTGSIISIESIPVPIIPRKKADKEQQMATE